MDTTLGNVELDATQEFESEMSIEELTALALHADPNEPISDDAVPFDFGSSWASRSGLPQWYMPALSARIGKGWRAFVIVGVVATLLAIEVSGLCSVFGQLVVG